jgi:hypothetical protein
MKNPNDIFHDSSRNIRRSHDHPCKTAIPLKKVAALTQGREGLVDNTCESMRLRVSGQYSNQLTSARAVPLSNRS